MKVMGWFSSPGKEEIYFTDLEEKILHLELSAENKKQLYIPKGFAHGFLVLSDVAEFCYKCTDFYHPGDEGGIIWNDPDIGIEWPELDVEYIMSEKDKKWGGLGDLQNG